MKNQSIIFTEIITSFQAQKLMDLFYKITGIPITIVDIHDKIQLAAGWQDICIQYHRALKKEDKRCIDQIKKEELKNNEYLTYKCNNGLWDIVTPIFIEKNHVATLFLGQFFYENEEPDVEFFQEQAKSIGVDPKQYLESLRLIPRFSREKMNPIIEYCTEFVNHLVDMSLKKTKQLEAERENAKTAIQKTEIKYKKIYDKTPVMLYSINPDGHIITVNNHFLRVLGYSQSEVIGKRSTEFLTKESQERAVSVLEEFWQTGKVEKIEYQMVKKSGEIIDVLLSADMEYDNQGKPFHSLAYVVDVTEQKKMENALRLAKSEAEESNRAKSEFLATMSHEIRTPLNAILGFTELLSNIVSEKQHRNYLEIIYSSGKNLLTLINDILDLAKIESGKIILEPVAVNLKIFLDEIIQIFSLNAKQKNLELTLELSQSLPDFILIDEMRLRQVLFNIIGNATKFTQNGYIKVQANAKPLTSENSQFEIRIVVEDSGIGISIPDQKMIFEAFSQSNLHRIKKFGGTGLGLTISKRLIEMMGGQISFQSIENHGSTFEICLNKVYKVQNDTKIQEKEYGETDNSNHLINNLDFKNIQKRNKNIAYSNEYQHLPSILIVDDEPINIHLLESIFNELYMVEYATSGKIALEWVENREFDLILLDIMMPNMDGFEVCKRLKANPKTRDIPIIFLTARMDTKSILKGFRLGAVDYITKPFYQSELLVRVKTHISIMVQKKMLNQYTNVLNQKNRELGELNDSKDKFFSILAHDLRGPLGTLPNLVNTIIKNFESNEKQELLGVLKTLQNTTKEIYELLENLLVWSNSQRGTIEIFQEKFQLQDLVCRIVKLYGSKATEKNISISVLIPETVSVYADINLTNTIIRNLISNSLKFTKQGGKITITHKFQDNFSNVSIVDTGVGINKENISKLFQISSKFQTKGTEKESGTGLGLLLCKEFVEKQGGSIWVESEVDCGSTFSFTLPSC
ncbi:MAG: PocR ligand-binding domain-containing protein [Leptospiraceae bacterium]|nr:PocR ligand-binding domain-containing protein [Leptospiraceae bacterium]